MTELFELFIQIIRINVMLLILSNNIFKNSDDTKHTHIYII